MKKFNFSLPYLMFWFEIPFFSVKTVVNTKATDRYVTEYIRVEVKFIKWGFGFDLYSPQFLKRYETK